MGSTQEIGIHPAREDIASQVGMMENGSVKMNDGSHSNEAVEGVVKWGLNHIIVERG